MTKYLKALGYEATLCFMGKAVKTYRITFRGDYIGTADNMQDAVLKSIFHDDERGLKILS